MEAGGSAAGRTRPGRGGAIRMFEGTEEWKPAAQRPVAHVRAGRPLPYVRRASTTRVVGFGAQPLRVAAASGRPEPVSVALEPRETSPPKTQSPCPQGDRRAPQAEPRGPQPCVLAAAHLDAGKAEARQPVSVIPGSYGVVMETLLERSNGLQTVDAVEQRLEARERLMRQLVADQLADFRWIAAASVPQMDGARSLREWVAAKLDMSTDVAGELTRAASLLANHPNLEAQLSEGEISFDRAVTTAKLVEAGGEDDLVKASAGFDIAGVRRLTSRHRRLQPRREREVAEERHVHLQPALDGLGGAAWLELDAVGWSVFEKGLHQRADELPRPPDGAGQALAARFADALVSIVQDSLDRDPPNDASQPSVTVFVDAELAAATGGQAGAEIAGNGLRLGPAALEAILCGGTIGVVGVRDGKPVWATPRSRAIPRAIRDFVLHRDGGCAIEGCSSRYRLQPHHVVPFAHGGSHDVDNLTTLCWYHHHVVVHLRGYTIDPSSPLQRRRVLPPEFDDP